MTLRVVGAGCGRTGTTSLKMALEQLLGAPCYHMDEVFEHPEHVPLWHQAALGNEPDWNVMLAGYAGAVDWPACAFWPELMGAFPDALVLLSLRDADAWWASANETIFADLENIPTAPPGWLEMIHAMFRARWGADIRDREASIAAFNAHNARVRKSVPAERLLVWQAAEGWEPICNALHLEIPDQPFPRTNTREELRVRSAAQEAESKSLAPTYGGQRGAHIPL